jgi:hypothetical protein
VEITTTADPTGGVIEFAVGTGTDPSAWVAGSWASGWDSTTGKATALTPLLGTGQALAVAGGTPYKLWARWHVGTEVPVKVASVLQVV